MKQFIPIIITVCFLLGAQTMFSQSASEDSKGDPITFPHPGGQVNVNIATNTIKIEELFRLKDNWLLGFAVSGKANNGIASILNTGSVSPGAKFSLNIGYSSGAQKIIKTVNDLYQKGASALDDTYSILDESLNDINKAQVGQEGTDIQNSIEKFDQKLQKVKGILEDYYRLTSLNKDEKKAVKYML
ncbi:MAG: hypothetical protein JSV88_05235, partial [Candidatus Aminicenantes bacterium]